MNPAAAIAALPKAELHLHLEGSIRPATVVELAARQGVRVTEAEVAARYQYADFLGFLDAYKWVTSFLRTPSDYAHITHKLADELIAQNVLYAEVTISAGVMLWRNQDGAANLLAIHEAGLAARKRGLRMQWIPDATRQFGPAAAMEVAKLAAEAQSIGTVAFGMGGDELSVPAEEFRSAFEYAASQGLHRVCHAGEIGGPEEVRKAVEVLGAERIGHGIAAMHSAEVRAMLRTRGIPLEICPASNICTGALARQLGKPIATIEEHPLRALVADGVPVVLGSDDPPMFHTSLTGGYALGLRLGFSSPEMTRLAQSSFKHAFLPAAAKESLLAAFLQKAGSLRLL